MTDVPPNVANVLRVRGAGVPGFSTRLARAVETWRLQLIDVLPGGWNSLVVECVTTDGERAVLKLPSDPGAVDGEAAALRWWGTGIAPRVFANDAGFGALLMERLVPGTALGWYGADDTALVIPLLERLHHHHGQFPAALPHLADVIDQVVNAMYTNAGALRSSVDQSHIEQAANNLRSLAAEHELHQTVVHGDLVPANVITAQDDLRLIDPRPCVGDKHYDAAFWSIFSGYGHDARANIAAVSESLELDAERLASWSWSLAVSRLVQIADSHAEDHQILSARLRRFVSEHGD